MSKGPEESPKHYDPFKRSMASTLASLSMQIYHPLEVLRTRFSVQTGKASQSALPEQNKILHSFQDIYKREGLRGLYRGVVMNSVSFGSSYTIFFYLYTAFRQFWIDKYPEKKELMALLGTAQASLLTKVLVQPLWMIRTRVIIENDTEHRGMARVLRITSNIYEARGLLGFYRGLSFSLMMSGTTIIQMTIYEKLREKGKQLSFFQERPELLSSISGVLGRGIGGTLMYPITTMRTRIQVDQNRDDGYLNVKEMIKKTAKEGAFGLGFFKGFWPFAIRGGLQHSTFFYFLEYFYLAIDKSRIL